jgi:hypothetical protein
MVFFFTSCGFLLHLFWVFPALFMVISYTSCGYLLYHKVSQTLILRHFQAPKKKKEIVVYIYITTTIKANDEKLLYQPG